ncbi:hypothetical protein [Niveibacterium sp.]|uniref:hypothetical protein n=1 Tax=Niveibacterium sp. TaxID=2017444 RepID=UPI0035B304A8
MLAPARRSQQAIAVALVLLMVASRGHHLASLAHLPGSSWAVFFLAGAYLRPRWALPALLGLAFALDYVAIAWQGVIDFCVSAAYVALIPAYAALWGAGRLYATRHSDTLRALPWLALCALGGVLICELISSGSFYFFSGRFAEPTPTVFAERLATYLPGDLSNTAFWIVMATGIHACFAMLAYSAPRGQRT